MKSKKLNLADIAADKDLLKLAQTKVRAGEKLTRAEKYALEIEASRLTDIILKGVSF